MDFGGNHNRLRFIKIVRKIKGRIVKKFFILSILCLIFGFFANSEEQSSNDVEYEEFSVSAQLAISSKEYLVTPGDVYLLTYAAAGKAISFEIIVDASYDVRIGNFGVIKAQGKTYLSLKKEVEEIVLKNYPMSGAQFLLVNPSTFKIIVKGEVKVAVEKSAWGLSRVSDVLKGCLTEYSSTRNVIVKSADGKSKTVDLFLAMRDGDFSNNPYVKPGDTIIVQRLTRKVTVSGEVERPGTYELLEGEGLKELAENYGNGLTESADLSRVEIYRRTGEKSLSGEITYLNGTKIDDEIFKSFELECFDVVKIASYSSLKPVLFIEGAILKNGDGNLTASNKLSLNFDYGATYAFFIRNHRNIFTSVSDLENSYVSRNGEKIPLDLGKILYDVSYYSDLIIENGDALVIPFKQFFVTVSGAVYAPGRYPYIPDRDYEYYVSLAGGFDKSRNSGGAVKISDISGKSVPKNQFITPESIIEAKTNSFSYYFNSVGSVVSVILNVITSFISVLIFVKN